jgi:soluble lytic murein transglycosylase
MMLSGKLSTVGVLFAIGIFASVSADAVLPVVPPTSLKNLRMSIPYTYEEAMRTEISGLTLEEQPLQHTILAQASDYIEFRRGRMSGSQSQAWRAHCSSTLNTLKEDPFCRLEGDRASAKKTKIASASRTERRSLADNFKHGYFDKAADAEYQDVIRAVSSIGDAQSLLPIARKALESDNCISSNATSALGYKLEELFPAPEVIELTKRLYRKASQCGHNLAAAQASFRLSLILIWQHQCGEVKNLMAITESVPAASQYHSRAKYWRYQCAEQLGDEAEKKLAREALLKEHPFTFQNLSINGTDAATVASFLKTEDPMVSVRSLIRPDLNGMIRAVEALAKQGANDLAAEIFDRRNRDVETLEPEVRLYTAIVLNRIGYALPKFKILSSLFQDVPRTISSSTLKMFFPLWYLDLVREKQERIDPLLILSLIRQESAFNKNARSVVGARGLMQVMPATARMVASVRPRALLDPAVNIGVGVKYLQQRLNQYGGDVELTLASYNAGFSRVDQWVKRYPTDNKMLFLDLMPFRETRDYVSSILRNYYFYVRLYGPSTVSKAAVNENLKKILIKPKSKLRVILDANSGSVARAE